MIRSAHRLSGYTIDATDGEAGRVAGFLLDQAAWRIRFVVVRIGAWYSNDLILLDTRDLGPVVNELRVITTTVSKSQILDGPKWGGEESSLGSLIYGHAWGDYFLTPDPAVGRPGWGILASDPPFRSVGGSDRFPLIAARAILSREVAARDGLVGRVVDLLLDDVSWRIPYLAVHLGNERDVALPTDLVKRVDPGGSTVHVGVTAEIVRNCPSFDPRTVTFRRPAAPPALRSTRR